MRKWREKSTTILAEELRDARDLLTAMRYDNNRNYNIGKAKKIKENEYKIKEIKEELWLRYYAPEYRSRVRVTP